MSGTLIGRDLTLRTTDKEGRAMVTQHRVWDAARFIEARLAEAAKSGGTVEALFDSRKKRRSKK